MRYLGVVQKVKDLEGSSGIDPLPCDNSCCSLCSRSPEDSEQDSGNSQAQRYHVCSLPEEERDSRATVFILRRRASMNSIHGRSGNSAPPPRLDHTVMHLQHHETGRYLAVYLRRKRSDTLEGERTLQLHTVEGPVSTEVRVLVSKLSTLSDNCLEVLRRWRL